MSLHLALGPWYFAILVFVYGYTKNNFNPAMGLINTVVYDNR